jgi:hypothetical protein
MIQNQSTDLSRNDLSEIRDAVPALDLFAIRSLRRAGFQIVRQDRNDDAAQVGQRPSWDSAARF